MGAIVLDMSVSLDGYVSDADGEDGGLHDWYFAPGEADARVIQEGLDEIGAMILGRRMLGAAAEGFDTPYKVPHFVLTHTPRATVTRDGVQFAFVADGLDTLVAQARAAAGGRVVCVAGGASTARQFLAAGVVDVIELHVVSRVFGGGLRLFAGVPPVALERTRVVESDGVTHLRYRAVR